MKRTVYFDTTIFVEMGTKRSKFKARIRELLKELEKDKIRIYTSIITVQELAVASYRAGTVAKATYEDVSSFARIYGITKEISLTAAKNEAALKDMADKELGSRGKVKPETEEQKLERICQNRRRKWDCFHLATAQQIGCQEVYSTDEDFKKKPKQLGIKNLRILFPSDSMKTVHGPLVDDVGHLEDLDEDDEVISPKEKS